MLSVSIDVLVVVCLDSDVFSFFGIILRTDLL